MKRLVFCFDGTWNRLDAPYSTNVVMTAESVLPLADDGTAQLIFYDEGVGTDKFETITGGTMGAGMMKNIGEAYRFLIFNHTPGDEIYVFGFSRGAYTARSFVGLLHYCGILRRCDAGKVNAAIKAYQGRRPDDLASSPAAVKARAQMSPHMWTCDEDVAWREASGLPVRWDEAARLRVCYLGVWDTVGSLGIPARYRWFDPSNKRYGFHDTSLGPFVRSARHAVALDERRVDFEPTLWDNVRAMNEAEGKKSEDPGAPYQQQWFPGVHGGVGGGGDIRGLSDFALDWVWDGARRMGLKLDSGPDSRAYELQPDYLVPVDNVTPGAAKKSLLGAVIGLLPVRDRGNGPKALYEVSASVIRRWHADPAALPDRKPYRPGTLAGMKALLDALDPQALGLTFDPAAIGPFQLYEVKRNDTLGKIAKTLLGDTKRWEEVWAMNRDKILDPNQIYVGQMIRAPLPSAAAPQVAAQATSSGG